MASTVVNGLLKASIVHSSSFADQRSLDMSMVQSARQVSCLAKPCRRERSLTSSTSNSIFCNQRDSFLQAPSTSFAFFNTMFILRLSPIGKCSYLPVSQYRPNPYISTFPLVFRMSGKKSVKASVAVQAVWDEDSSEDLNPVQRLSKAWSLFWKVMLPPPPKRLSSADQARDRLKLLLYYERGELSSELRGKLRETIVDALSPYVEIDSDDEVGLSVNVDSDIGTVYSVTVPVRRVKPEFQEPGYKDRVEQVFGGEDTEREERLYQALGEGRRFALPYDRLGGAGNVVVVGEEDKKEGG